MRLLVVSSTSHYRDANGIRGWGPTVRELSILADYVGSIVHVAPVSQDQAPDSALPYTSTSVELRLVPQAGGESLLQKLHILAVWPRYLCEIRHAAKRVDAVHVRAPANIALLALLWLIVTRRPRKRWVKFAGDWNPKAGGPLSYRLQRRMLTSGIVRTMVTVNGVWPEQPSHVRSFINPSFDREELARAAEAAAAKRVHPPICYLFVGRVEEPKGVTRAVEAFIRLSKSAPSTLAIIGDGPAREECFGLVQRAGLENRVEFMGWRSRSQVTDAYARAHILLLPTQAYEGWPKVLSEAMAYGVVPVTSRVASISHFLEGTEAAVLLDDLSPVSIERAVQALLCDSNRWSRARDQAVRVARDFSFERYLADVSDVLNVDTRA